LCGTKAELLNLGLIVGKLKVFLGAEFDCLPLVLGPKGTLDKSAFFGKVFHYLRG
jgi:hypothetical protein